ncbi:MULTISPECIES: tyrosine-type recombinase/integrase [Sphingobium]|uniref:tyrosine-type recombinase/integrase n=1 Tax=Sphingobium TaxID=165695 RepID=UPI000770210B|nr:integrase arm-type DNA-binding domain-containing protein [Sphingobium sp. TKS]AMK25870.1 integrase family protein [Sphingobium sp. TKS]
MLTDDVIQSLLPTTRPIKKSDGGGLHVCVAPDGQIQWRLAYRFDHKQKTAAGGSYPAVSIQQARAWRDHLKNFISEGKDPAELKRNQKYEDEAARITFFELAQEWLEIKRKEWSPRHSLRVEGRLKRDIFPYLGRIPARAILPRMVLEILKRVEERDASEVARRLRSYCSDIFKYGIPDGRVITDPCRDLALALRKRVVKHRGKIPLNELPRFYVALNADTGSRLSHLALRWTILTMVRTQETRFAQWHEFEGLGGTEPIWRIPPERMKMRQEHLVPLPPQAIALLREIRELNVYGRHGNERFGRYLFPVVGNEDDIISCNRMMVVMKRINISPGSTVHGFRSVASTVLNEAGIFLPDWIELQLAHAPSGVRAVYNSALYLKQRREMLIWWANYLESAERASAAISIESMATPKQKKSAVGSLDWFQSSW